MRLHIGNIFCSIPNKEFGNCQMLIDEFDKQKRSCSCDNEHIKDEAYQLRKVKIFEDERGCLHTKKEDMYKDVPLIDAVWKGFFENNKGLFLVTVAVGESGFANHCVIIDSFRQYIIDPSYAEPMPFQVGYKNGCLDKQQWQDIFKVLEYKFFGTMHQLYSKNSRFCVSEAKGGNGKASNFSIPSGAALDNADGVQPASVFMCPANAVRSEGKSRIIKRCKREREREAALEEDASVSMFSANVVGSEGKSKSVKKRKRRREREAARAALEEDGTINRI